MGDVTRYSRDVTPISAAHDRCPYTIPVREEKRTPSNSVLAFHLFIACSHGDDGANEQGRSWF